MDFSTDVELADDTAPEDCSGKPQPACTVVTLSPPGCDGMASSYKAYGACLTMHCQ